MKTANELLQYLHYQFPATRGHLPLLGKLQAVFEEGRQDGLMEAAALARSFAQSMGNRHSRQASATIESNIRAIARAESTACASAPPTNP
jgi:hypothetical protein